ncbi:Y-family DNA polymerase [Aliidiomarina sp. Khilg15.8]
MQPWAYLYLPALQLDNLQLMHPALSEQAVVLYSDASQLVIQANGAAMEAGIQVGMALSDAWVLAGDLQVFVHKPAFQRQLLEQLAEQLYQHFADLALDESHGMWVRLQAMQRLFASEDAALKALQAQLNGLTSCIRTGPTALAAQLLARSPQSYAPGDIDVRQTSLSAPLKQKLQRMGLQTIDHLQRMPSATLGTKLGLELVQFLAQLHGQQPLGLSFFQPSGVFKQEAQLAAEVHNWNGLRFPLNRLLLGLEAYLRSRQQMTRCVEITLFDRQSQQQRVRVNMAEGEFRAAQFYTLAQLRFEQQRLSAPALILRVEVRTFEAMQAQAATLTESTSGSAAMPLGALLNVLQTRLGRACIHGVAVGEGWLPECVQQRVPPGTPLLKVAAGWRPPWLLEPQPTEIAGWQLISQPERLVEPWWCHQERALRIRDYVVARDEHGRRGWIYFDHQSQGWFIQGWLDG